jgi:hypothetical protein
VSSISGWYERRWVGARRLQSRYQWPARNAPRAAHASAVVVAALAVYLCIGRAFDASGFASGDMQSMGHGLAVCVVLVALAVASLAVHQSALLAKRARLVVSRVAVRAAPVRCTRSAQSCVTCLAVAFSALTASVHALGRTPRGAAPP